MGNFYYRQTQPSWSSELWIDKVGALHKAFQCRYNLLYQWSFCSPIKNYEELSIGEKNSVRIYEHKSFLPVICKNVWTEFFLPVIRDWAHIYVFATKANVARRQHVCKEKMALHASFGIGIRYGRLAIDLWLHFRFKRFSMIFLTDWRRTISIFCTLELIHLRSR